MVQHCDERDGPEFVASVSQLEGLRSDLDGLIVRESFGRDSRGCFVGFQTRDRPCPRNQTSYKVSGSAPYVKNFLSSTRPHLADNPRAVEVVMAPSVSGIEAIEPSNEVHRLSVPSGFRWDAHKRAFQTGTHPKLVAPTSSGSGGSGLNVLTSSPMTLGHTHKVVHVPPVSRIPTDARQVRMRDKSTAARRLKGEFPRLETHGL